MNPLRLQRETIFSINSVVLASAIRGKSVLKGNWDVKEGGNVTGGNRGNGEGTKSSRSESWDGSIADLRFEISKMNREREMAGCWLIGHAGWWSKIAKNFTVSLPLFMRRLKKQPLNGVSYRYLPLEVSDFSLPLTFSICS